MAYKFEILLKSGYTNDLEDYLAKVFVTEKKSNTNIFHFDNYRELLKHLFAQRKTENKAFSYRYFSQKAGFASSNFLLKVMTDRSNLSEKSIRKFAKGFGLNEEESLFFKHLVLLNQAQNAEEKSFHAREILKLKSYREIHPLSEAQYQFFSNWYYMAVREAVNFPDFKEDAGWIAKTVVPAIKIEQAKSALSELQRLGLLSRNAEGKLVQTSQNLATSDEVASTSLSQCHKEMLKRASESIDNVPRAERDISFVTLGISKQNTKKIKELIHKFRLEVVELVSNDKTCDSVYQLNLQLFPIADQTKGGEK